MATIKRESVIDNWNIIVEQAAGRDKMVLDTTENFIKEANMPGVSLRQEEVSIGLFSRKRDFLILSHATLKEYRMFIGARDFGANLDVSWFLTLEPRGLKRALSKYATGNPQAFSMQLDIFSQQDLRAFTTVAHHCVKRAVQLVFEEMKLDPTAGLNTQSKGFLAVW